MQPAQLKVNMHGHAINYNTTAELSDMFTQKYISGKLWVP